MIKNARLIRLFTQSALAFILLFSPISGNTGSVASAHPKIHTEWVSTPLFKSVAVHYQKHNQNRKVHVFHNQQVSKFAPAGKIKSDRTAWLNQAKPRTFLQKTIPFGTEDELIA